MDLQRTSEHWDSHHFSDDFLRAEWSFHPEAKARLHRQLGAPSREAWFHNTYLAGRTGLRALGVGVGRAVTEINILSLGAIDRYDLYDLSPAALADGKRYAESRGLADKANFICADFQLADIPDGSYDVITFIASLHHIEQLEPTLEKCRRALAPGGVLWAAEYIGPDYFDYPAAHTMLARKMWPLLDPAIRKTWIPELLFPSVADVIAVDPTESVHSSDIPRAMRAVFKDVTVIPTYGTFAAILFWGLNYDPLWDTPEGNMAARHIMELDTALIDSGALPHYFAYLIARRPTRRQALARAFGLDPYGQTYRKLQRLLHRAG